MKNLKLILFDRGALVEKQNKLKILIVMEFLFEILELRSEIRFDHEN